MSGYSSTTTTQPVAKPAPSDVEALLAAGAAAGKAQPNPALDGVPYAVVPEGYALEPLPVMQEPKRPIGLVKLRDAASFIDFFNAHAVPRSTIYATLQPARFLAVFDDFHHAAEALDLDDQADWRGFRAEFTVPPSTEWTTWTGKNRQHMSQLEFAEFLQDNLPDVIEPAGHDLLDLALNFEAASAGSFVAAQRLQDGSHNLQWKAENNASGSVKLPESIRLYIPVFENEQPVLVDARLRYRVAGALKVWYELVRPHKVLEASFRETYARIAEKTERTPLLGSPE